MANEKSGKKVRLERNEYEAARKRLRTGGRTDSVAAAMRAGTVPEPGLGTGIVKEENEAKRVIKLAHAAAGDAKADFAPGWEAMNYRQMALGQSLQQIVHRIMSDESWYQEFRDNASPADLAKFLDLGVKLERAAMLGVLEAEKKRKEQKDAENNGEQTLAMKAIKNPELCDAIHDLIDDDTEDDD